MDLFFPLGCVGDDFPLPDPEISLATMHLQSGDYMESPNIFLTSCLSLIFFKTTQLFKKKFNTNRGNQDDPEDQMETCRLWENHFQNQVDVQK